MMIGWTGLAPWESEFPFPGSLIATFLNLNKKLQKQVDALQKAQAKILEDQSTILEIYMSDKDEKECASIRLFRLDDKVEWQPRQPPEPQRAALPAAPAANLYEKAFELKLSGDEVYYAACSLLAILKNWCSKLHCQYFSI